MSLYEHLVVVHDETGRTFICTLDHKCTEFLCSLERRRKIPNKLDELSEHERRSCTRFLGNTYLGQREEAGTR